MPTGSAGPKLRGWIPLQATSQHGREPCIAQPKAHCTEHLPDQENHLCSFSASKLPDEK